MVNYVRRYCDSNFMLKFSLLTRIKFIMSYVQRHQNKNHNSQMSHCVVFGMRGYLESKKSEPREVGESVEGKKEVANG